MTAAQTRTARTICPLCEATCGVIITLEDGRATTVRGDDADRFSRGFICPKGAQLAALNADPDRLSGPMVRVDGVLTPVDWETAFEAVAKGLMPLLEAHGRDSVALYLGNPTVHNLGLSLYTRPLIKALRTRNLYSASTVDQMPKHVSSAQLFGHPDTIPVPDLDHTMLLVVLGANPMISNGSLCTAPDFPGRLKALKARGGQLIVVDPKRTKTADFADLHLAIRPGADALLLAALVREVGQTCGISRLTPHCEGADALLEAVERFTPELVAGPCGLEASAIRGLAESLVQIQPAAIYGRIGTCLNPSGTIASWLVDALNALTGNLDRPGGVLFSRPAHYLARPRRAWRSGRHTSRVREAPEVRSELPVAVLPEEILTPGEGQVRGLITIAGNPALSAPDSTTMQTALAALEFMISVDPYLNETTRHADVILPPPPPLSRSHYDLAFSGLSVRDVARFTAAPLPVPDGALEEWQIMARLVAILSGYPVATPAAAVDGVVAQTLAGQLTADPGSALIGVDPKAVLEAVGAKPGPERLLDLLLRAGPRGLDLETLAAAEGGIDFGAIQPRLPGVVSRPSGKVNLAPEPFVAQLSRLLDEPAPSGLRLIGRRHLRSNNSWMHNLPKLASGANRTALQMNPVDAAEREIAGGDVVCIRSEFGSLEVTVELTDRLRAGVVSLPHGWGHGQPGTRQTVAAAHPGVNCNVLTGGAQLDPLSGNAWLNGVPVTLSLATP